MLDGSCNDTMPYAIPFTHHDWGGFYIIQNRRIKNPHGEFCLFPCFPPRRILSYIIHRNLSHSSPRFAPWGWSQGANSAFRSAWLQRGPRGMPNRLPTLTGDSWWQILWSVSCRMCFCPSECLPIAQVFCLL